MTETIQLATSTRQRVDSALNLTREAIKSYCVLPSEEAYDAVTLWVAATHAIPAFEIAPRLVARSPQKRCGKTRLFEVLRLLVRSPVSVADATVSYLFRTIDEADAWPPTFFLDEADAIFGAGRPSEKSEALRGIINTGFQRGFGFGRVEQPSHKAREFQAFAMVALASIGPLPDTIEDRAIVIPMRRRLPDEHVNPFRVRQATPELSAIREELTQAIEPHVEFLGTYFPELPVQDRAADLWEPLAAIAGLAGDAWMNRAWNAAICLDAEARTSEETSNAQLETLSAVRAAFSAAGDPEWILTRDLLTAADPASEEGSHLARLGASGLAAHLRSYEIRPRDHRFGSECKGKSYRREDFVDAWSRFLIP